MFPTFSQVCHPSFDGFSSKELPNRFVSSISGGDVFDLNTMTSTDYYTSLNRNFWRSVNRGNHELDAENWCVGLWVEDGQLYVDVSTSFVSLPNAVIFGREHKQLALWDNVDYEPISLV